LLGCPLAADFVAKIDGTLNNRCEAPSVEPAFEGNAEIDQPLLSNLDLRSLDIYG
jgi:hypothetical protein